MYITTNPHMELILMWGYFCQNVLGINEKGFFESMSNM